MAMSREWSPYQRDIFMAIDDPDGGHIVVQALAGTGKTTTIVEGLRYIPSACRVLFCAFNKSIADELARRVPGNVIVKTLHALGLAALSKAWGPLKINNDRGRDILNMVLPENAPYEVRGAVAKLVAMAKANLTENHDELVNLMYEFDCYPDSQAAREAGYTEEHFVQWCREAMAISRKPHKEVCFDDMVYVPAALGLKAGYYDFVFIDETQDMNKCQLKLAKSAIKPRGGRIVAIGDENQAIYGWRGADRAAMQNMIRELDAKVLPLSITYRCPKKIVAMAQEYVPAYEAAPSAPEGNVQNCSEEQMRKNWKPGDFVLSRTNAPLVKWCLAALADGQRAYIQGRDVGKGLQSLVKKSEAETIKDFLAWLGNWEKEQIEALTQIGKDDKIEEVRDRTQVLITLSEGMKSTRELLNRIENLFDDSLPGGRIMFSSTHRAKGLEAERVWLFENTYFLPKGNPQEEKNLFYVGITRSKHDLFMVRVATK